MHAASAVEGLGADERGADMSDIDAAGQTDDLELEDLEPEPADAENIKGGASPGADPEGDSGKGGKG